MYSSFIQTVRPVASLTAKLGVLPYSYNIYDRDFLNPHYNEEENKKLIDVWGKTEDSQVSFISLHILCQNDNGNKIDQIGMSKWHSDGMTQKVSVHCQVEKETAESENSSPRLIAGDFMSGDTEVIIESDVGPWLDATFRSFQSHEDTTCLVGHDIRRILHLVQPCWRVPSDVVILDTRAIWEFQKQAKSHPSLEQTLRGVSRKWWDESLLGNAGNSALFILDLLENEIFEAERRGHRRDRVSKVKHEYMRSLQYAQITPATWSSM